MGEDYSLARIACSSHRSLLPVATLSQQITWFQANIRERPQIANLL
jgi:hypothetical protein